MTFDEFALWLSQGAWPYVRAHIGRVVQYLTFLGVLIGLWAQGRQGRLNRAHAAELADRKALTDGQVADRNRRHAAMVAAYEAAYEALLNMRAEVLAGSPGDDPYRQGWRDRWSDTKKNQLRARLPIASRLAVSRFDRAWAAAYDDLQRHEDDHEIRQELLGRDLDAFDRTALRNHLKDRQEGTHLSAERASETLGEFEAVMDADLGSD